MSERELPDFEVAMLDLIEAVMAGELSSPVANTSPQTDKTPLPAAQAYVFDGDVDRLAGVFITDVHFFALTYKDASRLARRFCTRFLQYPHRVSSNDSTVLFDRVTCTSTPVEVEWLEDNSIRRFQATYSVSYRR